MRQHAGIVPGVGRDLGDGDVFGSPYEFLELPVRHGIAVDPEAIDGDTMRRRFLRIMPVRSHAERAAGNPDHPVFPGKTLIGGYIIKGNCGKKRGHL